MEPTEDQPRLNRKSAITARQHLFSQEPPPPSYSKVTIAHMSEFFKIFLYMLAEEVSNSEHVWGDRGFPVGHHGSMATFPMLPGPKVEANGTSLHFLFLQIQCCLKHNPIFIPQP